MSSRQRVVDCFGLMRIELRDAARLERAAQAGVKGGGKLRVPRRDGRKTPDRRDAEVRSVRTLEHTAEWTGGQPLQRRIERAVTPGTCCDTSICGEWSIRHG